MRISFKVHVHPTNGDYSFLLAHGVQQTKFAQALICNPESGNRVCNNGGYNVPLYPEATEGVFLDDPIASDASFDFTDVSMMTEATDRIGFVLLYNDATRPGWTHSDDDGSFLLKHKTKPMILVSETGGGYGSANAIQNGYKLVWKACPTNCIVDFTLEEYRTYGYVFESFGEQVCLPPGV